MKLIYNDFNKQTGQSIVILADKYGRYVGKAKCHPDDKQFISELMGCALAENRAKIKSLNNKLRITKIKLNTVKTILKTAQESHLLLQHIKNYKNEISKIEQEIEEINFEIVKRIEIRDNIINKIKKPAD